MKKMNSIDDRNLAEVAGGMDAAERDALIQERMESQNRMYTVPATCPVRASVTLTGPKLNVSSAAKAIEMRNVRRELFGSADAQNEGN